MTYSCIKRQFMKIYKAGYSRCINEKDVKVNIMRFRTLRSIEFQGLCSRNWNFSRSDNYIFGIYVPQAFYQWLTRVSKDSLWRYTKQVIPGAQSEKAWKLILCGFVPCVLLNFKASAAETWIFRGLKTIFLELMVHKLSTNFLLVYH
jgi:hypothetical protein